MFRREKRVLLRHHLEQGLPKAEIARRVGVGRRTVYHWIETGQLDRELDAEPARYGPRPEPEPEQRFETPPGHQGQVDFADFTLPWGKRYALVVVLSYSRMLWLRLLRAADDGDGGAGAGRWSDQSATCAAASSTAGSSSRTTTSTLVLGAGSTRCEFHRTLKQRPMVRFEDERLRLLPLVARPCRLGRPRRGPTGPGAEVGQVRPVVMVERRPLAEYAKLAGPRREGDVAQGPDRGATNGPKDVGCTRGTGRRACPHGRGLGEGGRSDGAATVCRRRSRCATAVGWPRRRGRAGCRR